MWRDAGRSEGGQGAAAPAAGRRGPSPAGLVCLLTLLALAVAGLSHFRRPAQEDVLGATVARPALAARATVAARPSVTAAPAGGQAQTGLLEPY